MQHIHQLSAIGELADQIGRLQQKVEPTVEEVELLRSKAYNLMPSGSIPATEGFFKDAVSGLKHIAKVVYEFIRDTINSILGIKSEELPDERVITKTIKDQDDKAFKEIAKLISKEEKAASKEKKKKSTVDTTMPFITLYDTGKGNANIVEGINSFLAIHAAYSEYLLDCLESINKTIEQTEGASIKTRSAELSDTINSIKPIKLSGEQTIFGKHGFITPDKASFSVLRVDGRGGNFTTYNVNYLNNDKQLFPLVKSIKDNLNSISKQYAMLSVSLAKIARDELLQNTANGTNSDVTSVILKVTVFYKYLATYRNLLNYLGDVPNMIYVRSVNRTKAKVVTSLDAFINALAKAGGGEDSLTIGNEEMTDKLTEYNNIMAIVDSLWKREDISLDEVVAVESLAINVLPGYSTEETGVEGFVQRFLGLGANAKERLIKFIKRLVAWLLNILGFEETGDRIGKSADSNDLYLKMRKSMSTSYKDSRTISGKLNHNTERLFAKGSTNYINFDMGSLMDTKETIENTVEVFDEYLTSILKTFNAIGSDTVFAKPQLDSELGNKVNEVIEAAYKKHLSSAYTPRSTIYGNVSVNAITNNVPSIKIDSKGVTEGRRIVIKDYEDIIKKTRKKVSKFIDKNETKSYRNLANMMVVLTYFKRQLEEDDSTSVHYLSAYYSIAQIIALYPKIIKGLSLTPFIPTFNTRGFRTFRADLSVTNAMNSRFRYDYTVGNESLEDSETTLAQLLNDSLSHCESIDTIFGEMTSNEPIKIKYRKHIGYDIVEASTAFAGNVDLFNVLVKQQVANINTELAALISPSIATSDMSDHFTSLLELLATSLNIKATHAYGDVKLLSNTNFKYTKLKAKKRTTYECVPEDGYRVRYPAVVLFENGVLQELDKLYSKAASLGNLDTKSFDQPLLNTHSHVLVKLRLAYTNFTKLYEKLITDSYTSPFSEVVGDNPAVEELTDSEDSEEFKVFVDTINSRRLSNKEKMEIRNNPKPFKFGDADGPNANETLTETSNRYSDVTHNASSAIVCFIQDNLKDMNSYIEAVVKDVNNIEEAHEQLELATKELRKALPSEVSRTYEYNLEFKRTGGFQEGIIKLIPIKETRVHKTIPESFNDKSVELDMEEARQVIGSLAELTVLEQKVLYLRNEYFNDTRFKGNRADIVAELDSFSAGLNARITDLKKFISRIITSTTTITSVVHRLAKR